MKNNTQPTNEKLLLKLLQKLKSAGLTAWDFTIKKVMPWVVAGSMAFTMPSCNLNENETDTSSNTDSSWTDSSNTTDSNLSTDSGSNSTDTSGGNLTEDKYSQYSELLQFVLTNQEYLDYIEYIDEFNSNSSDIKYNYNYPPHSFFESQGYNIVSGSSQTYVLDNEPNNLYMATYGQPEGTNYYVEYLLKYTLTDQEMSDYTMIHRPQGSYSYIECVFMNDAIAKTRTPEILSMTKVTIESHQKLSEALAYVKDVKTFTSSDYNNFIVTDYDIDNYTFELFIFPTLTNYNNKYQGYDTISYNYKIGYVPFIADSSGINTLAVNGDIVTLPTTHKSKFIVNDNFDTSSGTDATVYRSYLTHGKANIFADEK